MYIVIELQENAEGVLTNLVTTHNTLPEAESKYYSILAYAAVSEIPLHSAIIVDKYGNPVKNNFYKHKVAEPEPVEE